MSLVLTGLRAWIWQRLSAVYILAFSVYASIHALLDMPMSFEEWRGWIMHPAMNTATMLFFVLLMIHVWVGLRDVLLDYVHAVTWRTALLAVVGLALIAQGIWVLRVLWQVGGG